MNRNKKMFFAFIGNPIEQSERVFKIQDGYECWDLKKFTRDEFVNEIKKKIPPANKKILFNYKGENNPFDSLGVTKKQFEKASWGLLIPDTLEEGGSAYFETIFLLNLYAQNFLYPLFYVSNVGIVSRDFEKDPMLYSHTQNHSIFQKKHFVAFYKKLFKQSKYANWHFYRIQSWEKEDWRLFVAVLLFIGLKDYENAKSSFGWQRESAEMTTILETLFTADDSKNEEVVYRLCKRIAVLLHWKFPNIEIEVKKELYKARSNFVHGAFFLQIAKESSSAPNNIPTPDFDLLYKHKEYVRHALIAYLYLALAIKENPIDYGNSETVMDLLEESIVNIKLRNKIIRKTKEIFSLLPTP